MAVQGFRFSVDQTVILRDLDAFGHVNNAVYLTYVENARVAYLREVVGAVSREELRNIMASVTIDFRGQLTYGDTLEIGVRATTIGNRSFRLVYRLVRNDGELVADVSSVQVMFDFDNGQPIAVPAEWRRAIEGYDGLA